MIVFFMEQPSPEKTLMQNAAQENRSTPLGCWTADSRSGESKATALGGTETMLRRD
jgi:hypothetical protein